jgi:putative DNA primase/helicase
MHDVSRMLRQVVLLVCLLSLAGSSPAAGQQASITVASNHGDASALCAPLAAEGLEIVREQQRAFASYLSGANPAGRVTVVARTGWHTIGGESVFVLPGECIGPKRAGRVLLDRAAHGQYETKGTLAEWLTSVAALTAGHTIPMLAISTALAGPLLQLAGLEGGGLNLFGQSSRGKTTCLQAAASVWGRGETPGFVLARRPRWLRNPILRPLSRPRRGMRNPRRRPLERLGAFEI